MVNLQRVGYPLLVRFMARLRCVYTARPEVYESTVLVGDTRIKIDRWVSSPFLICLSVWYSETSLPILWPVGACGACGACGVYVHVGYVSQACTLLSGLISTDLCHGMTMHAYSACTCF